jgi:hypothetical protein
MDKGPSLVILGTRVAAQRLDRAEDVTVHVPGIDGLGLTQETLEESGRGLAYWIFYRNDGQDYAREERCAVLARCTGNIVGPNIPPAQRRGASVEIVTSMYDFDPRREGGRVLSQQFRAPAVEDIGG